MVNSSFIIIQWNIQGYFNNLHELELLIKLYKPAVIALQETHVRNVNAPHRFKAYKAYFHNNSQDRNKGGTAFLINQNIPHNYSPIECALLSQKLILNGDPSLTIVNIYRHPEDVTPQADYETIFPNNNPRTIILGDFNALWGSARISRDGNIIANWLLENDLVVLNNHSPTLFSTHNTYSAIDLTLTTPAGGF